MKFRFLACALLAALSLSVDAQSNLIFNHYTTSDGLSQNTIQCIYQDKKGFIWIGTSSSGLNKFDGYRFLVYKHEEDNPSSLSNNEILAIAEDQDGNLWVGTTNGLNRLDPVSGKFQRYYHDSLNDGSLKHNRVSALLVDSENNLWVGTYMGLQVFNRARNEFLDHSSWMTSPYDRKDREIRCMVEDQQGNLWLGVWWGGLKKYNYRNGQHAEYFHDPKLPNGIRNNNVISLCTDNQNSLWIGNFAGGITRLSLETGIFQPVDNPENRATIWSISKDISGRLWYTRTGIGIISPATGSFRLLDYSRGDPDGITSGYHYEVYCDNTGIMWLGSTEGLSVYNGYSKRFASYLRLVGQANRYYMLSFHKEKNKPILWLGTYGNGLIRYNEKTGEHVQILHGEGNSQVPPENYVTYVCEDSKNQIWAATGNGIYILDKKTGEVRKTLFRITGKPNLFGGIVGSNGFMVAENDSLHIIDVRGGRKYTLAVGGILSLPNSAVNSILQENDSVLWIGTTRGLLKYNVHSLRTEVFAESNLKGNGLSDRNIQSLFKDRSNSIWIGTQNGLNRYDASGNCFEQFKYDFVSQIILNISEDTKGNLWLFTEKGISKFNPDTKQIWNYDEKDGLKTDGLLHVSYDGLFYCNRTSEGFYAFHPDSIQDILQKPRVYITRFLLFNKEVPVSSQENETPLKADILSAEEIVLKHDQAVMSFEFTALNYTLPEKNKFAYKLEGFDREWYYTDASHRMATYTNLGPGDYIFRIKASNSDGVWSQESTDLKITILPPPWKTWWAYVLYVVAVASILLFLRHNLLQREKLKNKIKIEALEYEKKLKIDEMKMRFFANISHEFRTPLTLIMAPLHAILHTALNRNDQQISEHAGLIHRNANRLSDLINQVLDMQKLEAKSLRPEICQGNVLLFLKSVYDKFTLLSVQKEVNFELICFEPEITGWYDPDKTEKIVTNLLSNAFKFTRDHVKLELKVDQDHLIIHVEDNGKGIAEENIERIFDRFYHVDEAPDKIQEGAGIGLSLVKEMVDLLNGSIRVTSRVDEFTCFKVSMPLNKEAFSNYTLRVEPSLNEEIIESISGRDHHPLPRTEPTPENSPVILVVEDNDDLRLYLRTALSAKYRVIESADGKEGLSKAREYIPDIIISDVLMPEMDGVQLSQAVRNDQKTSHIPIILLTSLTSTDDMLKGLETGADDYITKPFNEDILFIRIANLIKQRKQLQRFYAAKFGLEGVSSIHHKDTGVENPDELFLEKTVALVERHLDNPDFNNEIFAAEMGMSVAVLYRKMNALMNRTPADLIRDLRLKRAVQLLETGKLSVTEVAGRVGFNDPHYFGKWFKKNQGKAPSELIPN